MGDLVSVRKPIDFSSLRNLIINGGIDFSQRGVTLSLPSSGESFLADRFAVSKTSTWTGTYDVASDAPTAAQAGFNLTRCVKVTNGTAAAALASDQYSIRYKMEGFDYSAIHSQPVRFQFWVKTSVAGDYSIAFENNAQNRSYTTKYSISGGEINTWVLRSIDLTMDTSGTWLFDNGKGVTAYWILDGDQSAYGTSSLNTWKGDGKVIANTQATWANNTGATFAITGIALYRAQPNYVLPFSRSGSVSDELSRCLRYFWAPFCDPVTGAIPSNTDFAANSDNVLFTAHKWQSSSPYTALAVLHFKAPMRAKPTATYKSGTIGLSLIYGSSGSSYGINSLSGKYTHPEAAGFLLNSSSVFGGEPNYHAYRSNSGALTFWFKFDAEL
jgi:hypothetical protein